MYREGVRGPVWLCALEIFKSAKFPHVILAADALFISAAADRKMSGAGNKASGKRPGQSRRPKQQQQPSHAGQSAPGGAPASSEAAGSSTTDELELWIVRHGQTEANHAAIIQGQSESPLSALGKSSL